MSEEPIRLPDDHPEVIYFNYKFRERLKEVDLSLEPFREKILLSPFSRPCLKLGFCPYGKILDGMKNIFPAPVFIRENDPLLEAKCSIPPLGTTCPVFDLADSFVCDPDKEW